MPGRIPRCRRGKVSPGLDGCGRRRLGNAIWNGESLRMRRIEVFRVVFQLERRRRNSPCGAFRRNQRPFRRALHRRRRRKARQRRLGIGLKMRLYRPIGLVILPFRSASDRCAGRVAGCCSRRFCFEGLHQIGPRLVIEKEVMRVGWIRLKWFFWAGLQRRTTPRGGRSSRRFQFDVHSRRRRHRSRRTVEQLLRRWRSFQLRRGLRGCGRPIRSIGAPRLRLPIERRGRRAAPCFGCGSRRIFKWPVQ